MATLSVTNPTLLDLAKATDPDGGIADIVEILNETNEVLDDMTWIQGNLTTGNRSSIRSGLPTPTWRKMYGGVQPDKGTTTQVDDSCGMLEAYAEVDKALADLNGNTAAFRLVEDRAHLEGLNQEIVSTLFYGNESTEPEAFTGFGPRFNSLSASNAENIIDGGGTGSDNNSIWLVVWSPQTCHGIIPKGSVAGLQRTDLGEVTLEDASSGSNTGRMQAYRTHYRWDAGLTVRDWRYVVRICNVDKSALTKDAASGADLPDLMFQAMTQIPNLSLGRSAFYMSRNTMSFVRRQATNATSGSTLEIKDVGGKMITTFSGIPLRRCDALSADEARIT
tara:strand:- start:312 stop:1316 length:1005 start_codon:yes stop_codon:yes gene_type:complete